MGRGLLRNRLGFWWLLLALLGATAAAVIAWFLQGKPAREAPSSAPVQIQSDPWHTGADVELILKSTTPRPGQVISLTLLAPGSDSPQIEGVSPDFSGLSGVQIPWLLPEYQRAEIALAAAADARYVGLDFDWRQLEPQRGQYAWQHTDEVVALAKQHELRLVPMLLYTPHWASTAAFVPLDYQHAPPADYADYRDFVYAVVDRFKPHGASPLTANGYVITDRVIWNEPNSVSHQAVQGANSFWTGSLEKYLILLRAGYEGAHAADLACNVLNGALADVFWTEGEQDLVTALERLYDPSGDGEAGDGTRPFFDTLNGHTYQPGPPDAAWYEERLSAVVDVMLRFGDEHKPIWMTETGYGSVSNRVVDLPDVDEEVQAEAVHLVYKACSSFPQVERAFWWSLCDYYVKTSAAGGAREAHYGLARANFTPKPAYLAYGRLTGRVGQVLTFSGLTDEEGVAVVSIPAASVGLSGAYVLFAQLQGVDPATVVMYEASTGGGE